VGILVFFVVGGGALSALGGQEADLDTARQLIAEKRFNEALLILTEVIRNDPEKTTEAESLIRQVRAFRESYSDRYEDLIHALYEERDVARALEIIRELEALDPNPNSATTAALEKARDSAQFIYEQQEFTRIMDDALVLLNRGEYWQASAMYEQAIGLGREHFDKADYGNIVSSRVDAVIDLVKRQAGDFQAAQAAQQQALEDMREAVEAGDEAAFRVFAERYRDVFRSAAVLVGGSLSAVSRLREQNDFILRDREDIFLGYTDRIIGGRANSAEPEGLRGAAQRALDDASRPAVEFLRDRALVLLEQGRVSGENHDWNGALGSFAEALRIAGEARRLWDLWYAAVPAGGGFFSREGWKVVVAEAPLFFSVSAIQYVGEHRSDLVNSLALAGIGQEDMGVFTDIGDLRQYRETVVQALSSVDSLMDGWLNYGAVIEGNSVTLEETRNILNIYRSDLDVWAQRLSLIDVMSVDRMAELELRPITGGLAVSQADYRRGMEFSDGVARQVEISPDVMESRVSYYPVQALAIFTDLRTRLDALEEDALAYVDEYGDMEQRFVSYAGITEKLQEAGNAVSEIRWLRSQLPAREAAARANVLQAERFRNEGNLRLNETQAAITGGNFEAARRAIAAARQSFSNSLALQDDDGLRSQTDERLLALNNAMLEAENTRVLAEVRSLIDQGRGLYEAGSYEEAETVLSRAQVRWQTTQTTQEPQIEYWLSLVKNALFVSSMRVILVTDPLYNEMNQLLNLAREDYTRAQEFASGGNRREALTRLSSADEKIAQVKKTFPFNQAASVLALRVSFLRDPPNSRQLFQTMFTTARNKIGVNNPEALSELQDLQQIDPGFPGISQAVLEVEVAMGLKRLPPSRQAVAESTRLTREANAIVLRNETAQFELALAMANQALILNPDNQGAADIKNRLQDVQGSTVTTVLPSAAEEEFRRAQQLFSSRNYFEALGIVERLLQTPAGRNYRPLQELQRRLESQIQ
jgi:tetratricopeptide (TPR) repeat protein